MSSHCRVDRQATWRSWLQFGADEGLVRLVSDSAAPAYRGAFAVQWAINTRHSQTRDVPPWVLANDDSFETRDEPWPDLRCTESSQGDGSFWRRQPQSSHVRSWPRQRHCSDVDVPSGGGRFRLVLAAERFAASDLGRPGFRAEQVWRRGAPDAILRIEAGPGRQKVYGPVSRVPDGELPGPPRCPRGR